MSLLFSQPLNLKPWEYSLRMENFLFPMSHLVSQPLKSGFILTITFASVLNYSHYLSAGSSQCLSVTILCPIQTFPCSSMAPLSRSCFWQLIYWKSSLYCYFCSLLTPSHHLSSSTKHMVVIYSCSHHLFTVMLNNELGKLPVPNVCK